MFTYRNATISPFFRLSLLLIPLPASLPLNLSCRLPTFFPLLPFLLYIFTLLLRVVAICSSLPSETTLRFVHSLPTNSTLLIKFSRLTSYRFATHRFRRISVRSFQRPANIPPDTPRWLRFVWQRTDRSICYSRDSEIDYEIRKLCFGYAVEM